jgi:hypothetical protein
VRAPLAVRFWGFVDKTPGYGPSLDCWRWRGTQVRGYGQISVNGRQAYAHRVAYELLVGPIPPGEGHHGTCVCHRCDVRDCTNPAHLFLGSMRDNVHDCMAKDRYLAAPQRSRINRGEGNPRARLRPDQVLAIRKDWRKLQDIADDYGIARSTACQIRGRNAWKHLNKEPQ